MAKIQANYPIFKTVLYLRGVYKVLTVKAAGADKLTLPQALPYYTFTCISQQRSSQSMRHSTPKKAYISIK